MQAKQDAIPTKDIRRVSGSQESRTGSRKKGSQRKIGEIDKKLARVDLEQAEIDRSVGCGIRQN